jgi:hypothetical protein
MLIVLALAVGGVGCGGGSGKPAEKPLGEGRGLAKPEGGRMPLGDPGKQPEQGEKANK